MRPLFIIALLLAGCTTVTPHLVAPPVALVQPGSHVLTAEQRDRYNGLISLGYGTPKHRILPALKADSGVTPGPNGTWLIDNEHAVYFVQMNREFHSGIAP
jgi:hypothetical protein